MPPADAFELSPELRAKRDRLLDVLRGLGGAAVAFSGGIDSTVVARAAALEHQVRHPLQEAGFTKADVRALARAWGLPTWDKPASPCLSSRLAPGVEVTRERTARVEAAEEYLHALGYRECRVRLHEGELARVEVPAADLARLADPAVRGPLVARLKELGFRFVTLDLEGFRSGSLNTLVSLEVKSLFSRPTP